MEPYSGRRSRWRAPASLVHERESKASLLAQVARIRMEREAFRSRSRSRGHSATRSESDAPQVPVTTEAGIVNAAPTAAAASSAVQVDGANSTLSSPLLSRSTLKWKHASPYRASPAQPTSQSVTAAEVCVCMCVYLCTHECLYVFSYVLHCAFIRVAYVLFLSFSVITGNIQMCVCLCMRRRCVALLVVHLRFPPRSCCYIMASVDARGCTLLRALS